MIFFGLLGSNTFEMAFDIFICFNFILEVPCTFVNLNVPLTMPMSHFFVAISVHVNYLVCILRDMYIGCVKNSGTPEFLKKYARYQKTKQKVGVKYIF